MESDTEHVLVLCNKDLTTVTRGDGSAVRAFDLQNHPIPKPGGAAEQPVSSAAAPQAHV